MARRKKDAAPSPAGEGVAQEIVQRPVVEEAGQPAEAEATPAVVEQAPAEESGEVESDNNGFVPVELLDADAIQYPATMKITNNTRIRWVFPCLDAFLEPFGVTTTVVVESCDKFRKFQTDAVALLELNDCPGGIVVHV